MSGALSLRAVSKTYDRVRAVDRISLDVVAGEFVTLLGPSGSGKTTTLQMITGFVDPDEGQIILDGRELTALASHRRNIGMVFQNYALFPHMNVEQNIAFPLEARGIDRAERRRRIGRALDLVGLGGFERRLPRQLSGGQQQRVALARAIVFQPPLLLMDEPLGALDKKLRDRLQLEIMELSRTLGVTVIYVTHDQEEALAMSNRIAVFHRGRIEQVGPPAELYERPASVFVAGFVGESNMFTGTLEAEVLRSGPWQLRVDRAKTACLGHATAATIVVRPERLRVEPASVGDEAGLAGIVRQAIYLGATMKYVIELSDGRRVNARMHAGSQSSSIGVGDAVGVSWDIADGIVLPGEPEQTSLAGEPDGSP